MLARRPETPNPPRRLPAEARMARRSLHRLNPSAQPVNGTGRIRRIQLQRPRGGRAGTPCLGPAVRTVFVSWPEALRGGWAVVNSHKGTNGAPIPSSDVSCVGTRDRLRGASPTNGVRRRSTRGTLGAGLTAGANRRRRARRCGEGVQASNGCQRRGGCNAGNRARRRQPPEARGPRSPCQGRVRKGAQRVRTSELAGERSALKGARCVREGPAGKASWAGEGSVAARWPATSH
jgi:hypothetical protein